MWWSRVLFYLSVIVIILAAFLVSIFQFLTPVFNDHRSDFEKWTSEWLKMPVKIERVSVGWYRYYPLINLEEVSIYHPDTHAPLMKVNQVSAAVAFSSSIWQRRVVLSSFLIKGTTLNAYQNDEGEYVLQGFPEFKKMQASETPFDDLVNAFSNQPKVILQNVEVFYTAKDKKQYHATIHSLKIANNHDEHRFTAHAVLQQAEPTTINLQADWEGNVFSVENLNGHLYVDVSGLSLGQWLKGKSYQGLMMDQGMVTAKNWVTIVNGSLQRFQTQFEIYDGRIYSEKQAISFRRFSGEIGANRHSDTWAVAAKDILVDMPTFLWPSTGFYAVVKKNMNGHWIPKEFNVTYLNIEESIKLLSLLPTAMTESYDKTITELRPRGNLYDLKLSFQENEDQHSIDRIEARFKDLSFNAISSYPGATHLSGSLAANKELGKLLLTTIKGHFIYPLYFSKPLSFDQMTGELNWQKQKNNTWNVIAKQLHVSNDAVTLVGAGTLTLPDNGAPSIDLSANFSVLKVEAISQYLPDKVLEPGLNAWLSQAFLKGVAPAGKLTIQGVLNQFPFDNEGTFLASALVKNVDFRYAPDWPIIRSVNGSVTFSGRKVIVDVDSGQINRIDIGKVSAIIPYLGESRPAVVDVVAQPIDLDLSVGTAFLMQTPLKDTYAKILQALHPTGLARLQLQLIVPLHDPEKTAVKGALSIKGSQLDMQDWGLQINRLNGAMTFTENDILAEKLVGEIFKQPITVQLKTEKKNKRSMVAATFATHVKVNDIENWLKLPATKGVSGETDLKGIVYLSIADPFSIDLTSSLTGVALDIQKPYQKNAQEKKSLRATISESKQNELRLQFNYDDALSGAMILNKNKNEFLVNALSLTLGGGVPTWPTEKGLSIYGVIDRIDWNEMQASLKNNNNPLPASLPLKYIDIKTKILSIFNQQIKNLRLQVYFYPTYSDVHLSSSQVTGHIKLPAHFSRDETITIDLDSIIINSSDASSRGSTAWDLRTMPAISFYTDNIQYNKINFGQMSFKTATLNKGIAIQDFLISSNHLKLNGAGFWTATGGRSTTQLSGTASSNNVSGLLKSFGFDVHNYILKSGQFKYNLNWNQPPFTPEFKSMTGNASLKIGKGQILEVKETSGAKMDIGRMLSIFSLQTIPRRLSFDFSDLFQSGYSFDIFQGDFSFKSGKLYTNNTHFEGPVARIGIQGNIGLINKDYDLTLSVTPYVTSSIPVAATLLTANPVVGVAAFAANKVLGSAISQATTYYYSVKGPWDNPSWSSIRSVKASSH